MRSAMFQLMMLLTCATAFAIGPVNTSGGMGYTPENERPEVAHAVGSEGPLPISHAVNDRDSFAEFLRQVEYEQKSMDDSEVAFPEPETDFSDAGKRKFYTDNFEVVVHINKFTQQEWIHVHNGHYIVDYGPYDVSTGQEKWGCDRGIDKATGKDLGCWNMVWTGTPTGCFPIDHCDIDHRSKTFNEAPMPHACFLSMNGKLTGMALHEGVVVQEKKLSHGCVRQPKKVAEFTFDKIIATQNNLDPESLFYKAQCPPWQNIKPEICAADPESVKANKDYKKEIDKVVAGLQGKTDSFDNPLPYDEMPSTPSVSWDCNKRSGTRNRKGPSAIVLIDNVDPATGKNYAKSGKAGSTHPRQQPLKPPAESIQAICQNNLMEMAKKDRSYGDLNEPWASEATACSQTEGCMSKTNTKTGVTPKACAPPKPGEAPAAPPPPPQTPSIFKIFGR